MKYLVIAALAVLSFGSVQADEVLTYVNGVEVALRYPTVKEGGVEYKLIVKDKSTGHRFATANGYCVLNGYRYAEMTASTVITEGPFAILGSTGRIEQKISDNSAGRYDIAFQIQCQ